jgi:predicted alpha/beta-fold hydrolase
VFGVCPVIDPEACVQALERRANWIYERHFVIGLKARLRRKAALFPARYSIDPLARISRLRQFDQMYTAPDAGFPSAEEYYDRAGARHVLSRILVPTLIITAHDDPFVPFSIFDTEEVRENPSITVLASPHGGHCAFIQRARPDEDPHWAEHRIVEAITGQLPEPQ